MKQARKKVPYFITKATHDNAWEGVGEREFPVLESSEALRTGGSQGAQHYFAQALSRII